MARIVLVTTSNVDRELLADVISPDDDLHVVVPAVEQSRLEWLANDEDEARSEAQRIAESVTADAPTDSTTPDISAEGPGQAVRDAIARHRPDRVLIAVREGDAASWLEASGLDQVQREIDGVPVVRVSI